MLLSNNIFEYIITRFINSPKGVFSKREILTLLDVAKAEWMSESTRELDKENKELVLNMRGEKNGRVEVNQTEG